MYNASISPVMNSVQAENVYLTAREAAEYLRVSLSTLYRMECNGRLAPLRTPGGHRRYTVRMLNSCLDANEEPEP